MSVMSICFCHINGTSLEGSGSGLHFSKEHLHCTVKLCMVSSRLPVKLSFICAAGLFYSTLGARKIVKSSDRTKGCASARLYTFDVCEHECRMRLKDILLHDLSVLHACITLSAAGQ